MPSVIGEGGGCGKTGGEYTFQRCSMLTHQPHPEFPTATTHTSSIVRPNMALQCRPTRHALILRYSQEKIGVERWWVLPAQAALQTQHGKPKTNSQRSAMQLG